MVGTDSVLPITQQVHSRYVYKIGFSTFVLLGALPTFMIAFFLEAHGADVSFGFGSQKKKTPLVTGGS